MGTAKAGEDRRKRSIVVSGSNAQDVRSLSLLLERFGYDVSSAHTPSQARELAFEKLPALIITDAPPPGSGAGELYRLLKDDGRTATIPVVFMVPLSDAAAENRCLGLGAAACITKPIQMEEVFRTVQEIIEPRPRAHMRIDTQLGVTVDDEPLDCGDRLCNVDLSEYGMYVPMSRPLPRNREITLHLHIKDRSINARGSVLFSYVAAAGSRKHSGMGLKFTDIAPSDRDYIRKYIREEVLRGISPPSSGR